jgi:HEAT repeat protein
MSTVRKNQKKLSEAFELLQKNDAAALTAALSIYKDHGQVSVLADLFRSLEGRERAQQQAIISFLSDVKDTDATEAFVTYLQDETNSENRKLVLSAIWTPNENQKLKKWNDVFVYKDDELTKEIKQMNLKLNDLERSENNL